MVDVDIDILPSPAPILFISKWKRFLLDSSRPPRTYDSILPVGLEWSKVGLVFAHVSPILRQADPDANIYTHNPCIPIRCVYNEVIAAHNPPEKIMARYILIDNNSGYIFGDTADFAAGRQSDINTISDAARMLDESIGEMERTYTELRSNPHTTGTGYDVYRADINGSEAVPVVTDGQDQDTIAAVIYDCEYVGYVEVDLSKKA